MSYSEHLSDVFLATQRQVGDGQADALIANTFADPQKRAAFYLWLKGEGKFEQNAIALSLPAWADQKQMKAGSEFFIRHSELIMSLLGLLSLPYCYCAADGAMVLYQSEKIRNQTTMRLYETAIFVWEVMAPDAFGTGGKGFEAVLKIRLLHAMARHHLLQSGQWDYARGLPVNQEDMAGTNLAFSFLVLRGMHTLGIKVSSAERQSFMHLWNVIGFLMGLQEDLIPQEPEMVEVLDKTISRRQFRSSEHGIALTRSLVHHVLATNKGKVTENDILGLMKYLLGKNVAAMLGINCPDLPAYKLFLIKTINKVKSIMPIWDMQVAYQQGYAKFQLQRPQ